MAVFNYVATVRKREEFTERGTISARNEKEAEQKLLALDFSDVRLKRISGVGAIFKQFTADIR